MLVATSTKPVVLGARLPLVQMLKTALAVGIAWAITSNLLDHPAPYLAAVSAVLCLQVTVYESVSRGLQRALGAIVGVLLVYFLGRLLGVHAWSVALIVLVGLTIGSLLRLGAGATSQIAVTSLLVLAVGSLVPGYALDRVVDTAVGAAVAIAVNVAIAAPTYTEPARVALMGVAHDMAALLRRIGARLGAPDGAGWWDRAQALSRQVDAAGAAVARADESLRWNLAAHAPHADAERERHALGVLERAGVRIRGVTKSLDEALADGALGEPAADALAQLLEQAARSLDALGASLATGARDDAIAAVDPARFDRALELLAAGADGSSRRAWLAYGSIVVDLRRLVEDASSPARAGASGRR